MNTKLKRGAAGLTGRTSIGSIPHISFLLGVLGAAPLFSSCTSRHATSQWWQPHELSAAGAFTEEDDRNAGLNGQTYTGTVGLAWPLGMQRESYKANIEAADVAERLNAALVREVVNLRETGNELTLRLVELEEAAAVSDGLAEQEDDGTIKLTAMVTDKTAVSGMPVFAWYALSAIAVALAAGLWSKAGLPLPFVGKRDP